MLDRQSMQAAIEDLIKTDPHVRVAAIVSPDGLVLVSSDDDRDRNELLAAMVSEVVAKGAQSVEEMSLGRFVGDMVFGSDGGIFLRSINDEMLLVVTVSPRVHVGRVYARMNVLAERLAAA